MQTLSSRLIAAGIHSSTRVRDALGEHIREEEEQIFPRIEQIWGASRREEAGQQIAQLQL